MIPNQWYVILESREVKVGKPVGVTRMGEKMVAWRDSKGAINIQGDICPHRGAALHQGKIIHDRIMCPFHGFEFDSSGECQYIPANGKNSTPPKILHAKTYQSIERHGYIFIWWGEEQTTYPGLPIFEELENGGFSHADYKERWETHYSRAIENQLDVFHLPFPHRTTIGRGNRTIADGPITKMVGNEMQIWLIIALMMVLSQKEPANYLSHNGTLFCIFYFPIYGKTIFQRICVSLSISPRLMRIIP